MKWFVAVSVIGVLILCQPCGAYDINGIAETSDALLRAGTRFQLAVRQSQDRIGPSGAMLLADQKYGTWISCPIGNGAFKYAWSAGENSPDGANEVARLSFKACPGNCTGSIKVISRRSTE
jgi:hypothetical protein